MCGHTSLTNRVSYSKNKQEGYNSKSQISLQKEKYVKHYRPRQSSVNGIPQRCARLHTTARVPTSVSLLICWQISRYTDWKKRRERYRRGEVKDLGNAESSTSSDAKEKENEGCFTSLLSY